MAASDVTDTKTETENSSEPMVGVFNQPITKEDPLDPFDRQKCIQGWKQAAVEQQCCLVLGVGGIGCTVAMALSRLGVGRIILVDYDVVECSNLNRQILFSLADVGQKKIEAAQKNLQQYHVIAAHTKIEAHHFDVIKHWDTVLQLAAKSNVIFNNIDYGGGFDIAVLSLCMKLKIPYVSGSSYCHSWIVEFFTGQAQHSSFSYDNREPNITDAIFEKLKPHNILSYTELTWLPQDDNPPTRLIGSSPLCAVTGGMMTVNAWAQGLVEREEEDQVCMPNYSKMDVCHYWDKDDLIAWPMPEKETEAENDKNADSTTKE